MSPAQRRVLEYLRRRGSWMHLDYAPDGLRPPLGDVVLVRDWRGRRPLITSVEALEREGLVIFNRFQVYITPAGRAALTERSAKHG